MNVTKISDTIYRLGSTNKLSNLQYNSYLIIQQSVSILLNPTPVINIKSLYEAISSLVHISSVKYVILTHQSSDIYLSAGLLKKYGLVATIIVNERYNILYEYYNLNLPIIGIKSSNYTLIVENREFRFIPTPNLMTHDAFIVMDQMSKTIFTGELFSVFSKNLKLFADKQYITEMIKYHKSIVPANESIKPILDLLLVMDIKQICPFSGSIISENISKYLLMMKKQQYGKHSISYEDSNLDTYSIAAIDNADITLLEEKNKKLEEELQSVYNKMLKCPITDLYNEVFLKKFIENSSDNLIGKSQSLALCMIYIDNIISINYQYGTAAGDETLHKAAYLIKQIKKENMLVYKMNGPYFGLIIANESYDNTIKFADTVRIEHSKSQLFPTKITVSIGLSHSDEFPGLDMDKKSLFKQMLSSSDKRMKIALKKGADIVQYNDKIEDESLTKSNILFISADEFLNPIMDIELRKSNYRPFVINDGITAIDIMTKQTISAVIADSSIEKINVFEVREIMLRINSMKNIPFILLVNNKNPPLFEKASKLDIYILVEKPVLMSEIIGLLHYIIK